MRRPCFFIRFETFRFQIFKLFLKKALSNLPEKRENIRSCSADIFFLHSTFQNLPRQLKYYMIKEKVLGAAWFHSFDQLSQLNENKLNCSLYKEMRLQQINSWRTLPNGYKSRFPHWNTCFRMIRFDQCFQRRRFPNMQMRPQRKMVGTMASGFGLNFKQGKSFYFAQQMFSVLCN